MCTQWNNNDNNKIYVYRKKERIVWETFYESFFLRCVTRSIRNSKRKWVSECSMIKFIFVEKCKLKREFCIQMRSKDHQFSWVNKNICLLFLRTKSNISPSMQRKNDQIYFSNGKKFLETNFFFFVYATPNRRLNE